MSKANKDRNSLRKKRHLRIRRRISGSETKPRLYVFRSLKNIYAQLIDDDKGVTIASASTLDDVFGSEKKTMCNIKFAAEIGKRIAQIAKEKKISEVVFDKGGYRYHGKIKALADAARQGGLKF